MKIPGFLIKCLHPMMLRCSVFILIFYFPFVSPAQQFGGNPPSVKWKQLNTDTARIIFPAGREATAQRVAGLVHSLAAAPPAPPGNKLHKINIVLQHQTILANGYVALGPYRSEFFLTPEPNNFDIGSISWPDMLALHEYRHVMQMNNFRNGLSKAMYRLFGDDGLALAQAAAIPDWFFEGDAVYQETILSGQGRGRLPLFLNAFPSLWQAGKNYSLMKLRNGSWKDYVPDHYHLGYLLVNYGYEKYGMDFWKNVTHDASAFKGLFYPFQKAVKKYAGINYKTFVADAFEYYSIKPPLSGEVGRGPKMNRRGVAGIPLRQAQGDNLFPENKKWVTHYRFPYQLGSDSLLYLKSSYRERPSFYIRDASGEHKLRVKDISADAQFSYRNGKIVYAAYQTDPRWAWRDYSVIKLLDLATNRQQTITRRSKYFTPDISPDGKKIAAVQNDAGGESALHIIDVSGGKVIKSIHSSGIQLFTDPKFIDDLSLVTAVRLADGNMSLAIVYWPGGKIVRLTPPSLNVMGYPCVNNGIVYFTASYEGNDELFAVHVTQNPPGNPEGQTAKLFKLTHSSLGNYFVNALRPFDKLRTQGTAGKIVWSAFTANGYQLMQADEKELKWEEADTALVSTIIPRFPVSHASAFPNSYTQHLPQRNFAVEPYKKSTGLLHIHSWRPYYSDPEFSYSVYSENILNTLQTELYYLYNQNEKEHAAGLNAVYGAGFPWLSMGTQVTFNRQTLAGSRVKQWNQLDSRIGVQVPLLFTGGRTFRELNMGSSYFLRNEFNKNFYKDSLGTVSFSYLSHFFSWSQQVQQAIQHIYPRWGYNFSLAHRHVISKYQGYQFLAGASGYLPGIHATHSLVLSGAFQQRDTLAQVSFSDRFSYSRGYTGSYFSRMWRLSANYHFPLFYPDWGFAHILYLLRVRANTFYDFTRVYSRNKSVTRDQRSAGGEIYLDTKWWNQYPLTFGFRISRLLDRDQYDGFRGTRFELIVPVSIIPK